MRTTALRSPDTGQLRNMLKETTWPLAWSPDGKRLAATGPNNLVLMWDSSGKERVTLAGHAAGVTSLAWSPDGKLLASTATSEKRVRLWDADKAESLRDLGPFPAAPQSVRWSPKGKLLAFNVPEIGWHVWDVERDKLANDPKSWKDFYFDFAPDGRSALTVERPYPFQDPYRLRDLDSGKERGRLSSPESFSRTANAEPARWSPDGHLLALPVNFGVELWRGDLRRRMRTLKATHAYVSQIAFSGDGKLVAGLAGERLHIWESDTGRLRGILLPGHGRHGLTLTPDGHYTGDEQVDRGIVMVVQKDDGTQEILEPADFEQKYGFKNELDKVHLLKPLPPSIYPQQGQPMGPYALVRQPAELPEATSWTIETRSARGQVQAVAYRPDGGLLATGGNDGTIRLWNPADGKLVRMMIGDSVNSLSWSPDGKILAAGSGYGFHAWLWEADTGRRLRRLPRGCTLAWSPDGHTLVLINNGPTLELWDVATESRGPLLRFSELWRKAGVVAGRQDYRGWSPR